MSFVFRVVFFLKENVLLLTTSPRPVSCCFVLFRVHGPWTQFTARELGSRGAKARGPLRVYFGVFTSVYNHFSGSVVFGENPQKSSLHDRFSSPAGNILRQDKRSWRDDFSFSLIFHVFSHFSIPPHPPCNDEILIFFIFLDKTWYLSFLFFWTKHHHCMGGVGGSDFCIEKTNFRKNDQNCENWPFILSKHVKVLSTR